MPLDQSVVTLLDSLAAHGAKPFDQMSVSEGRAASAAFTGLQAPRPPLAKVVDVEATGADGRLPTRVFVPEGEGPFPTILYIHGGGWAIGDLALVDQPCAQLAATSGAVVIAVQYRWAPESAFPAAVEDAYAALGWAKEHAAEFGGDPDRLAVLGDSAGGGMASAVTLMARDRNGPEVAAQILVYPFTARPDSRFPSRAEFAEGYLLQTSEIGWFFDQYLRTAADAESAYLAPLYAPDLANLPPALVLTMEFDPVRDEGEAYATALAENGNDVTARRFDGLIHGTFWLTGAIPESAGVYDAIAEFVRARLS